MEPDYFPNNETSDIFLSNINQSSQKDNIFFDKVLLPTTKSFSKEIDISKIQKVLSLDGSSSFYINNGMIYYSKKETIIKINESNFEKIEEFKLDLDKDEHFILIDEIEETLFALSNKSKLFKLNKNSMTLVADFENYINSNPILLDENLLVFTVFGDIFEINLKSYNIKPKGKFDFNHGISLKSNTYIFDNSRLYLFNSGTLIFLNKFNNQLQTNFYLEDLNILSSLDLFNEFIDAPFEFDNYLYFIDKKGLISIFNPLNSEILWEFDINSSINDYLFNDNGDLALLTNNKILILDRFGNLIFDHTHLIENPNLFLIYSNNLYIFNNEGITIIDLELKVQKDFLKLKLNSKLDIINSDSNTFFKDKKNLYKLSE